MGILEVIENALLNDGDPRLAQTVSKPAQGRWIHKGVETLVRDIAKILHGPGFFNSVDDFFIAELSQSGQDGNRDHSPQGVSGSAFVRVIKGREAIDDGLPRNQTAQEDEIVSGVRQIVLDPLSRKSILKGVCYHSADLCEGLRHVAHSHR